MEWIEISAKTVPLAIERALDTLGVHETELEYETLEEGKATLFGLRKTDARIRARVKPISREKPQDKRRRKQRDERKGRGSRDAGGRTQGGSDDEATKDKPAKEGGRDSGRSQSKRGGGQKTQGQKAAAVAATDAVAGAEAEAPSAPRAPKPKKAPRDPENQTPKVQSDREGNTMNAGGTIEEQVTHAQDFGIGLLDAFGIEAEVNVSIVADDVVELAITGQNLGLLVGPKAATLAALEEILRGSVGHRGPARLNLDVAGYKQKRREALAKFAQGVAAEVAASGVAKALEPMSAPDRKVVHDAVAEIEGVSTISDGEDQRRRVVIQPAS